MTRPSSNPNPEDDERHHLLAWLLLPLSLFPLVALLTYDARVYTDVPAPATTNWIGALGDFFAYYGYLIFGLAIWIVPALCVIVALGIILGRRVGLLRRILWFLTLLAALACLLQVIGAHGGLLATLAERLNIACAGGALGYLVMTCCLSPLVSDFGSSVIMTSLIVISLVGAIGTRNCAAVLARFFTWVAGGRKVSTTRDTGDATTDATGDAREEENDDDLLARAQAAKEEARRLREEEKERARAEKLAAKEAKREAKEAEKRAKKEAAEKKEMPAATASVAMVDDSDATANDKGPYILPPISLLNPLKKVKADHGDVSETTKRLIDTLKLFGVDATPEYTVEGPVVTKYAIRLEPGTRYSAVTSLSQNLMGALHAKSLRIEAPIPGEEFVGIEVPNQKPVGISFREVFESDAWRNAKGELPLLFGKNAAGKELVADLASMPHMLVAGATGQGKSVCLNALINGLLMTKTPDELKLIMVDPKSVEFTAYAALPHLIVPVITDNKKVVFSLRWAVQEMERRLKLFARARVRNIYDFNHRLNLTQTDMFGQDAAVDADMPRTVPYIVIIIDEVADLMASNGKEVTPDIARLTAKARAAGIHLILATQRPDAKIITGTIKANIPGRVAFKTATGIDSRTILDESGAENLIGRGDMLFKGKDGLLIRAQGAWISDEEIMRITSFIEQHSTPAFDERFAKKLDTIKEEENDIFSDGSENNESSGESSATMREQVKAEENANDFKKALECIINTNRASTSHFQRKLGWGYNHSAKIMDMLEDAGVIGPQVGAGPRQIVMDQDQILAIFRGEDGAGTTDGAPDAPETSDDDNENLQQESEL